MVTQIDVKTLYEQDFCLWIDNIVDLLKTRQLDQIDYENLIEEIEDMGRSERQTLESIWFSTVSGDKKDRLKLKSSCSKDFIQGNHLLLYHYRTFLNVKSGEPSNLIQVLMHLLKWKYQKNKRTNSWRYSIIEHRDRLETAFRDSPSLKGHFNRILEPCYQKARRFASEQTGMDINTFPEILPFTKEEILDFDYLPDDK